MKIHGEKQNNGTEKIVCCSSGLVVLCTALPIHYLCVTPRLTRIGEKKKKNLKKQNTLEPVKEGHAYSAPWCSLSCDVKAQRCWNNSEEVQGSDNTRKISRKIAKKKQLIFEADLLLPRQHSSSHTLAKPLSDCNLGASVNSWGRAASYCRQYNQKYKRYKKKDYMEKSRFTRRRKVGRTRSLSSYQKRCQMN